VSPDGKYLVFLRDFYWSETSVLLFDIAKKKIIRLFEWDYPLQWIGWSHDSQAVFFNDAPRNIIKFSINDRTFQTILKHNNLAHSLVQSPNKSDYVFVEAKNKQKLWQLSLADNSNTSEQVSHSLTRNGVNLYPKFANHSDTLAYMSLRTGQPELFLKIGREPEQQITHLPYWLLHEDLQWSPDDNKLLTIVRSGIYSFNLQSGIVTQHTMSVSTSNPHRLIATAANWSSDGQWIYFASDRDGDWQIWKIPADGDKLIYQEYGIDTEYVQDSVEHIQKVTTQGGLYAQESKDGKYLYYSKYHQTGIWRIDLRSENPHEILILSEISLINGRNWLLGKQGIYYNTQKNDVNEIRYFDFESKNTILLNRSNSRQSRFFTINAQETKMVISQNDGLTSNILTAKHNDE